MRKWLPLYVLLGCCVLVFGVIRAFGGTPSQSVVSAPFPTATLVPVNTAIPVPSSTRVPTPLPTATAALPIPRPTARPTAVRLKPIPLAPEVVARNAAMWKLYLHLMGVTVVCQSDSHATRHLIETGLAGVTVANVRDMAGAGFTSCQQAMTTLEAEYGTPPGGLINEDTIPAQLDPALQFSAEAAGVIDDWNLALSSYLSGDDAAFRYYASAWGTAYPRGVSEFANGLRDLRAGDAQADAANHLAMHTMRVWHML